jgi:hypothetical protein
LLILHSSIFKMSFQIRFVSSFDGNLNICTVDGQIKLGQK